MLLPSTSSAEPGPFPGIPHIEPAPGFPPSSDRNLYAWLNAPYNGLAGSVRAMQWTRIPLGTLASNTSIFSCHPVNDLPPCGFEAPEDATDFYVRYHIAAFLVSPDGSDYPYGYGQVATVRSVAFGAVPVEVDLQVRQARDADGLPVPFLLEPSDYGSGVPGGPTTHFVLNAAEFVGQVSIAVIGLRLDGIDVELEQTCSTGSTELRATSEPARGLIAERDGVDLRKVTNGIQGGGLSGTVDIPAFEGCVSASGDDVGPILTAALSGPNNPVSMQYGQTSCFRDYTEEGYPAPTPPGADTPAEAGCVQYQLAPDLNPESWSIPLPWPFPDHAPGAPAP